MDFLVRPRNQAPEMSVEVSNVTEAEESKTVKIKSQSHVDHVLRCVHSEFLLQGQMINQQVYKEILRLLLRSVCEKRRELRQDKLWLLHHDSAPAHNALNIRQFLAEKKIAILEQSSCLPDLAPCDFFLFPKLKGIIKWTRFEGVEAIKRAITTAEGCPRRILPAVHRSVAEKGGKVR